MARWRPEARRHPPAGLVPLLALGLAAACQLARVESPVASHDAARPTLRFAARTGPGVERDLAWLRAATEPRLVRVHDPYEGREIEFRALDLARVLDAVYGAGWRGEEELLFSCSDGYEPTVSVTRVLEHRAWLAFARTDRPIFELDKREAGELRHVRLEPFYLVWENLDDPVVRAEGDHGWPYQLEGIVPIRSAEHFPAMAPPPRAAARVHDGFAAFRRHCSRCHRMNGDGGTLGPELNRPVSPVEYREPAWLRQWIDDPARINPGARMPAMQPGLADRERTIEAILAYMTAMAAQRRASADGTRAAD